MKKHSEMTLPMMKKWVDDHQVHWLEEYFQFLRFPSISSEPDYQNALMDCAAWVIQTLQSLGFQTDLWPTTGHPVIFASDLSAGPDQPTLLIYNHYDVQPADPVSEWQSPPFEPTLREGQIYARGAQDNKGQCFYVLQALKMIKELHGSLPINIKLCIEGEEEVGSAGLDGLLAEKKEQLKANYLAIVDVGIQKESVPALTLGLRGILTMDVEVQGSRFDLHSGSHGGIVPNPIHALASLLTHLRDSNGRILVPGFYQNVQEMSAEERSFVSFSFDEESYWDETGARPTGGEKQFTTMERAWVRPTLEINGIHGGYTGKGFKTVIPAKAYAKLSCRIVPNQDPKDIGEKVKKYLEDLAPPGVEVKVHLHRGQGMAVRISPTAQVVKAFSKAFEDVFMAPCQFIYEGASIPIVPKLAEACGGETILLGLGLTSDQIHAPNEHFGLDRLKKGMLIMGRALQLLGETRV